MCLSMLYPLGLLVKSLVEEKETRTQELMSIMGLQQWTLAAAHAATYAVIFSLVAILAAALLQPSVFPTTDQSLLTAFLMCYMAGAHSSTFSSFSVVSDTTYIFHAPPDTP